MMLVVALILLFRPLKAQFPHNFPPLVFLQLLQQLFPSFLTLFPLNFSLVLLSIRLTLFFFPILIHVIAILFVSFSQHYLTKLIPLNFKFSLLYCPTIAPS